MSQCHTVVKCASHGLQIEPKMFAIGASRNGGGTQASLQMGGNNAKFVEWLSLGQCPLAKLRGSRR